MGNDARRCYQNRGTSGGGPTGESRRAEQRWADASPQQPRGRRRPGCDRPCDIDEQRSDPSQLAPGHQHVRRNPVDYRLRNRLDEIPDPWRDPTQPWPNAMNLRVSHLMGFSSRAATHREGTETQSATRSIRFASHVTGTPRRRSSQVPKRRSCRSLQRAAARMKRNGRARTTNGHSHPLTAPMAGDTT